jgi:hypothetical protein
MIIFDDAVVALNLKQTNKKNQLQKYRKNVQTEI